jgi:hypothetical protein
MANVVYDKDLGFKKLTRSLIRLSGDSVVIGFFGDGADANSNVAEKAVIHEFGTKDGKIPKRPTLRPVFDEELVRVQNMGKRLMDKAIATGSATYIKVLRPIGIYFEQKIKLYIDRGNYRKLADSTIKRKGHSTPLWETGKMQSEVTYKKRGRT